MNFLAHMYLSGESDEIRLGNFIGDYVKGHDYRFYPDLVRKGIILHRDIDTFTDSHPIVRHSKMRFVNAYHKYAGVIVDILYDHFLAVQWDKYSREDLSDFLDRFYYLLESRFNQLPREMQGFMTALLKHNWFLSYTTIDGIERVLQGMSRRTSLPDETEFAINLLRKDYDNINQEFQEYFPQLVRYVEEFHSVRITGRLPEKPHLTAVTQVCLHPGAGK
jgi:acyl carrier protein phosphodiesterase